MNNMNPIYLMEAVPIQLSHNPLAYQTKNGYENFLKQKARGQVKQGLISNRMARRAGIDPSRLGADVHNFKTINGLNGTEWAEKIADQNQSRGILANHYKSRKV